MLDHNGYYNLRDELGKVKKSIVNFHSRNTDQIQPRYSRNTDWYIKGLGQGVTPPFDDPDAPMSVPTNSG